MKRSTGYLAAVIGLSLAGRLCAQAPVATAHAPHLYHVGQRVEYVDDGKWYKAVIVKVASDEDIANFGPYHVYYVHSLGYTWDKWVSGFVDNRAQLRAAGSGPTEVVPGGEANDEVLKTMHGVASATPTQPAAKAYTCGSGQSFTIAGRGAYTDSDGKRGTYTYVPASATLRFVGGNLGGQRARYETSYGVAKLHILGPSGRQVVDCD
jgi:hypothetical protein